MANGSWYNTVCLLISSHFQKAHLFDCFNLMQYVYEDLHWDQIVLSNGNSRPYNQLLRTFLSIFPP